MSKAASDFANEFRTVFQKAAQAAQAEKEALASRLQEVKAKRDALDAEIQEIKTAIGDVDAKVAVGLKHAALDAGVKLQIGRNGPQSASGSRQAKRDTAAAMEKVHQALPIKNGKYMSSSDISARIGVDLPSVKYALAKLKKQGKVESNGKRGLLGGWRQVT